MVEGPESTKGLERGLIQLYTGDGKGKTTAALGQAFRAAGHGLKTLVIQFMKGNIEYGELEASRRLGLITIRQMGRETFVSKENPDPVDVEWAEKALAMAAEEIVSGRWDMLILDELNVALDFALVTKEAVERVLDSKPPRMELLLTGRYAPGWLKTRADLVTEMREVKHYYNEGVAARVGIER